MLFELISFNLGKIDSIIEASKCESIVSSIDKDKINSLSRNSIGKFFAAKETIFEFQKLQLGFLDNLNYFLLNYHLCYLLLQV